jgi:hypothetical protein
LPLKHSIFFIAIIAVSYTNAQTYNAYNGSAYGGVFGVYNNPASSVNTAFKWDVNIFSIQGQVANGIVTGFNPVTFGYDSTGILAGQRRLFFNGVGDGAGLHIRSHIGSKTAIAVGLKGKLYTHTNTSNVFISDTLDTYRSFFFNNRLNQPIAGNTVANSWLQADINIAKTLFESYLHKVSVGVNIGIMKSIVGAYGSGSGILYNNSFDANNKPTQNFTGGSLAVSYSNNLDAIDSNMSVQGNIKNVFSQAHTNTSISIGVEWLINSQSLSIDHPINTNYDWKFGLSIVDIGKNTFMPAGGSFTASQPKAIVNTDTINKYFSSFESLKKFRDNSILPHFNQVDTLTETFAIQQPTRIIISVDKSFDNNFNINALLNINLFNTNSNFKLATQNLSILTITPRWETKNKGYFFPIQYTTNKQLLVGAAAKFGPVLLGLHNIMWLVGRADKINGGAYLAFHLKPKYREKDNSIKNPRYVL